MWTLSIDYIEDKFFNNYQLPRCPLAPEIMHGGELRSSSTSKAGKSPYNLYISVGEPNQNIIIKTFV